MTGRAVLRADPALAPHPPLVDVHVHLSADGGAGLSAEQWPALASLAGIRAAAVVTPSRPGYAAANAALLAWANGTEGSSVTGRDVRGGDGGGVGPRANRDGGSRADQPALRAIARLGGPVPRTTRQLWQLRAAVRSRLTRRPPDLPGLAEDPVAALRHYAGVKVTPQIDGVPSAEVLEAVSQLGLPVLVPAGEGCPPAAVEELIVRHVSSPVVLCHLGSYPGSAPDLTAAIDLVRRHDHALLETSAAWLAEFVTIAAREVPHRLMFGSGAPFVHPLVAWHHVASAVEDDEALERIGFRTAEEVLGW